MIPIDELVEIWVRVHKEVLARDDDLSWWREACKYLHPDAPPLEDNAILEDEEEKR